jgi:hypothetical protein
MVPPSACLEAGSCGVFPMAAPQGAPQSSWDAHIITQDLLRRSKKLRNTSHSGDIYFLLKTGTY